MRSSVGVVIVRGHLWTCVSPTICSHLPRCVATWNKKKRRDRDRGARTAKRHDTTRSLALFSTFLTPSTRVTHKYRVFPPFFPSIHGTATIKRRSLHLFCLHFVQRYVLCISLFDKSNDTSFFVHTEKKVWPNLIKLLDYLLFHYHTPIGTAATIARYGRFI